MRTLWILILALLALPHTLRAEEPAEPPLVTGKLVADVEFVRSGSTFTVGVLLNVRPGWHIYWENPGDAGSPTTVRLTLPEGSSKAPTKYPIPSTFVQPGNIRMYGYAGQVMLLIDVVTPYDFMKSEFPIKAEVSWLACNEDKCTPGQTTLELNLNTTYDPSRPSIHALQIIRTRSQLPRMPAANGDMVRLETAQTPARVAVTLNTPALAVEWYPKTADGPATKITAKLEADGRKAVLTSPDGITTLPDGVLVLVDAKGSRRGLQLTPERAISTRPVTAAATQP